jgi:hypothetical protein
MIAIRNTVMEFKYICRNIKAKLTFTHLHSGETLIVGAWFTVFENDKPRKPVDSVSLFSNERAWVVICVRDIGGELYPFSGPGNAPNLLPEWTIKNLGDERQRLTFGKWQVKIVITSDSGDELYREEGIQAIE